MDITCTIKKYNINPYLRPLKSRCDPDLVVSENDTILLLIPLQETNRQEACGRLFRPQLSDDDFKYLKQHFVLFQVKRVFLSITKDMSQSTESKTSTFYDIAVNVDKEFLEPLNQFNFPLSESEVVVPYCHRSFVDAMPLISQFRTIDLNTISAIVEDHAMFGISSGLNLLRDEPYNFMSLLESMDGSKYWKNEKHCNLDFDKVFLQRRLIVTRKDLERYNINDNNYESLSKSCGLQFSAMYLPLSETANTTSKDSEDTVPASDDQDISKVEANNYLLDILKRQEKDFVNIATDKKQFFPLITSTPEERASATKSLLRIINLKCSHDPNLNSLRCVVKIICLNPKYAHMVINNRTVWDRLANLSDELNRKACKNKTYINNDSTPNTCVISDTDIAYAWLTCYMNESVKKSYVKESDAFVFTSASASVLPFFPSNDNDYHQNPYLSLPLRKQTIMGAYEKQQLQFGGIKLTTSMQHYVRLSTAQEFRERFNIFVHGLGNDYFEGIDTSELAFCGSVIPACIHALHPHQHYIQQNPASKCVEINRWYPEHFDTYVSRFYESSDLDIMSKVKGLENFTLQMKDFVARIDGNTGEKTMVEPHVVHTFVIEPDYYKKIQTDVHKWIVAHPFEALVAFPHNCTKESVAKLCSGEGVDNIHPNIVTQWYYCHIYCNMDLGAEFRDGSLFDKGMLMSDGVGAYSEEYLKTHVNQDNFRIFVRTSEKSVHCAPIVFRINIKYKLHNEMLRRPMEMFQIHHSEYFSSVSQFHLPCVRGYYRADINEYFLLPSCISANLTFVNIERKFFSCKQSPIDILNKYRKRGFGCLLNPQEMGDFLIYTLKNRKGYEAYGLTAQNIKENTPISTRYLIGSFPLNHPFFKPSPGASDEQSEQDKNSTPINCNIFLNKYVNWNEVSIINPLTGKVNCPKNCW